MSNSRTRLLCLIFSAALLFQDRAPCRAVDVKQVVGKQLDGKEMVGQLAATSRWEVSGNTAYTTAEIVGAIIHHVEYLEVSYPETPFDELAAAIKSLIVRGYRRAGFLECDVSVTRSSNGSRLLVRIAEGPRYQPGELRVSGAQKVSVPQLQEWCLNEVPKQRTEVVLRVDAAGKPSVVRETNGSIRNGPSRTETTPTPLDQGGSNAGLDDLLKQFQAGDGQGVPAAQRADAEQFADAGWNKKRTLSPINRPLWSTDEVAVLTPEHLRQMRDWMLYGFCQQGFYWAKYSVDLETDSRAKKQHLRIKIEDEGPQAVVRQIRVRGNYAHSREELLSFLQLEGGQRLSDRRARELEQRLSDSGRFLQHSLMVVPSPAPSESVDVYLDVRDTKHAPKLDEPLTDIQQALLTSIQFLNKLHESADDIVLDLTFKPGKETTEPSKLNPFGTTTSLMNVAYSGRKNFVVRGQVQNGEGHLGKFAGGVNSSQIIVLGDRCRYFVPNFPELVRQQIGVCFEIKGGPDNPEGNNGTIAFFTGWNSSKHAELVRVPPLKIGPHVAFEWAHDLADGEITRTDKTLRVRTAKLDWEFEKSTGRLIRLSALFGDEKEGFLQLVGRLERDAVKRAFEQLVQETRQLPNLYDEDHVVTSLLRFGAHFYVTAKDDRSRALHKLLSSKRWDRFSLSTQLASAHSEDGFKIEPGTKTRSALLDSVVGLLQGPLSNFGGGWVQMVLPVVAPFVENLGVEDPLQFDPNRPFESVQRERRLAAQGTSATRRLTEWAKSTGIGPFSSLYAIYFLPGGTPETTRLVAQVGLKHMQDLGADDDTLLSMWWVTCLADVIDIAATELNDQEVRALMTWMKLDAPNIEHVSRLTASVRDSKTAPVDRHKTVLNAVWSQFFAAPVQAELIRLSGRPAEAVR